MTEFEERTLELLESIDARLKQIERETRRLRESQEESYLNANSTERQA